MRLVFTCSVWARDSFKLEQKFEAKGRLVAAALFSKQSYEDTNDYDGAGLRRCDPGRRCVCRGGLHRGTLEVRNQYHVQGSACEDFAF